MKVKLLNESFMDFEIGQLPFDREHSAMGEYHLVKPKGYCGAWYDPVANYNYRGPSWIITENNGKHFMEQMRVETDKPHRTFPMLIAGDVYWRDYTATANIRMLHTSGSVGVGVCCQNCLNYVAVVFENGKLQIVYRHKESCEVLAAVPYDYDCDHFYKLSVSILGEQLICKVNDVEVLKHTSPQFSGGGKVAITATMPAQFEFLTVEVSVKTAKEIELAKQQINEKLIQKQSNYPKMKLWKSFDLKDFGCGRQIRFGHLLANNQLQIVFAQCQKRIHKDAYATISCLTAMDLSGNILWQVGTPMHEEEFGMLTADLPLQVYDIDGDGFDEVIYAKDFEIFILDGRNGTVKNSTKTPKSLDDGSLIGVPFNKYAFDRLNPDGIRIANLSGNPRPSDIILKDRYCRLFALDKNLNLMWTFKSPTNTGHFPYTVDVNNDGHDEVFCGYNLLSHTGEILWSLPVSYDHTDEIVAGRFDEKGERFVFGLASGTQGFMLCDLDGNILCQDKIGHAQRISVGNYCPEHMGFEFCLTNFWGHNSVIYLYDCHGKPIWELETQLNGNIIAPVNWTGNGTDLILLNADVKSGGLIDGNGDQVVLFPDDNHPELCVEAVDICGDSRDELVVWDKYTMCIYTQDDNPKQNVIKTEKYPHFNASNYRGEYSVPDANLLKPK